MKKCAGLLTVFVLLLLQVGGVFAQVSDYEIIDTYKKKQQSLMESLKTVQDPAQCDNLGNDIGRLEAAYEQHRKLLAEGLYPESFDASIARLREQLKKSRERIALAEESKKDKEQIQVITTKVEAAAQKIEVISKQNAEYRAAVDKLTQDVQELSTRIQRVTEENTGLLSKIKALQQEGRKDKESIAKLRDMTEKLNANIQDRNQLIVKMMDSLFSEYAKPGLTDAQKKSMFVIAQDNDYVSKIVGTIDGNVKYVESALLTPQNAKLIRDEQKKLAAKWDEIKPFVGKLYPDEQLKTRELAAVDSRLTDLKRSIDETTWKSIHQIFTAQNIAIVPFRNAGEFSANLLAYIDEQLRNPSREKYQTFRSKVWDSPIKDQWLPVIPVEELTERQRTDIEERIALWDKKIATLFWRWLLIGGAGVALIAIVVVLARRKKKPLSPAGSHGT